METFIARVEDIKRILKVVIGIMPIAGGVCIGLDILVKPINTGVLDRVILTIKQLSASANSLGAITILTIIVLILALKK